MNGGSNTLKIAFFGTPDFVVDFLDVLSRAERTPSLIITGPDVPVGRKLTMTAPAPKNWADVHSVTCLQPEKIDADFITQLVQGNFDLFIVIAYGKILPEALITLPRLGTINVHYSLLPKYRGASPVESAILAGETETGVCIQQMVYELDAGDILTQKTVAIDPDEHHEALRTRLNDHAFPLLLQTIENLEYGRASRTPQNASLKTICKKIKKTDGLVTLDEPSDMLYRKYRAYFGWPGIFFFDTKQDKTLRVKITKAHMENGVFTIDTVIPEGKKEMSYHDYKNWN